MAKYRYDVALSFSGAQRSLASFFAGLLESNGLRVYFDDFERWSTVGKNLVDELSDIYESQCRFCVILVSAQYLKGPFTNLELRSALDRMILAGRNGYILPILLDTSWIRGLSRATGLLDLRQHSLIAVGEMLLRRIAGGIPEGALDLPVAPEPSLLAEYVRSEPELRKLETVRAVRESFEKFKGYLTSARARAADWVSQATVAHYANLRQHALVADREELRDLFFADRLIALRLRVEIPLPNLQEMNAREVLAWGVRRGLVNKENIALGELRSVALLNEHIASAAVIRREGSRSMPVQRLRFVLERGRWRADLVETLRQANRHLDVLRGASDVESEETTLLDILSQLCGRRIGEEVWTPPLATLRSGLGEPKNPEGF
jgi:TIR domain